jgi:hypothetical protein
MKKTRNKYDNKYWEEVIILEYMKDGVSIKNIVDMFNVSDRDAFNRLKGLKKNNLSSELVIQKYMELHSISLTSEYFNVTWTQIKRILTKFNIPLVPTVRKQLTPKWTEEKLVEIISQYDTREELKKNNSPAFHASAKKGLLLKFFPNNYSKRFRHLYVFLFQNSNVAYVGLTCNVNERYKSHLNPNRRSPVFKYINKTNETFEFKVLTDTPLPELIAAEKECDIIYEYRLNGWTLLNKKKGGDLGGFSIWTYEKLKELSSTYTHQRDFILNEKKAYEYAQKIGILDDIFSHMVKTYNHFTYDEILEEAKKYTNLHDFKKNSKTIYNKSKRIGITGEITLHMRNGRPTRWNYDLVLIESKKYKTKSEFQKKNNGAYKYALKNGILDEVCSHMKIMKNFWSIDEIFEISKQYDSLVNLRKGNEGVYRKAVKLGISKKLYLKT